MREKNMPDIQNCSQNFNPIWICQKTGILICAMICTGLTMRWTPSETFPERKTKDPVCIFLCDFLPILYFSVYNLDLCRVGANVSIYPCWHKRQDSSWRSFYLTHPLLLPPLIPLNLSPAFSSAFCS